MIPHVHPRFAWRPRQILACLLLLLLTAGCSLRLAAPEPVPPTADEGEELRQAAARSAAEVHRLANAVAAVGGPEAASAEAIAEASAYHLDVLGGVWEPWPGAGPEATAYPGPSPRPSHTAVTATATPGDLHREVVRAATEAREQALAAAEGEAAIVYGAIALRRMWASHDLAEVSGQSVDPWPTATLTALPADVDDATLSRLDAARFAFEVVAARSRGQQRDDAERRAEELRELVGSASARRVDAVFDVSAAVTQPSQLAATAELDVVAGYLMAMGSVAASQRAELFDAAAAAAGGARSWGATPPALLGLESKSPSPG